LRFAGRAAFFGVFDALDNDPPLGIESWDNLRGGVRFWSGGEAYDFLGLMLGVVASMCIVAYPQYTEATGVFVTRK
jgi:hypothetical protein